MNRSEHPDQAQLALYAENDLGFWERRRVANHVNRCSGCQDEVRAFQRCAADLRQLDANAEDDLTWNQLSDEMTGNIRVGLAAGEAIAGFEKSIRNRPRLLWHTAFVLASATAILLLTLWLNLPKPEMDHLAGSLSRIRWDRIGKTPGTPVLVQDSVVLEAGPDAIQVRSNGRGLSFLHPVGASVSLNMQESAGVRYVDDQTGQVTMNKVYYAQ